MPHHHHATLYHTTIVPHHTTNRVRAAAVVLVSVSHGLDGLVRRSVLLPVVGEATSVSYTSVIRPTPPTHGPGPGGAARG